MDTKNNSLVLSNRFRLITQIGKGSFGSIFRAFDLTFQEEVAIKIQREKGQKDPLEREVGILQMLCQE